MIWKSVRVMTSNYITYFLEIYNQMMARKNFKENVDPYKMGKMNEELDDEYKLKVFIAYKDKLPVASIVGSSNWRYRNLLAWSVK